MGLFSPKWQNKNESKAISAIENLNNQDELFKAAMQSEHASVRVSAAKKINDRKLLNEIAKNHPNVKIRNMALDKLPGIDRENLIAYIYRKNPDEIYDFLESIDEKELLKKIATDKECAFEEIRKAALDMIKDKDIYLDIIKTVSVPIEIRLNAIDYIKDKRTLIDLADRYFTGRYEISERAFSKVRGDYQLMLSIAFDDKCSAALRGKSIEALEMYSVRLTENDCKKLYEISQSGYFYYDIMNILSKCNIERYRRITEEKVRRIERHPIEGSIANLRYTVSGSGKFEITHLSTTREYELKDGETIEIKLFNGDLVEHDNSIIMTPEPYTMAEQIEYDQYLNACATDNI